MTTRTEYLSTTVPQWLAYFERLKTTIPGNNKFFVADKATHADLYACRLCFTLLCALLIMHGLTHTHIHPHYQLLLPGS